MSVPTFLQTKTGAEDSSASTTATITPDSAIRAQGGSTGPSAGVVTLSFDGDPGTVTATDTSGNTWYLGTSTGSGSTFGVMLYAFNMAGGVIPTINVAMTNSVKKKWAFAELDQVAPISPYDGTSNPLDKAQARVDTTSSVSRTSSVTSPVPAKRQGQIAVCIGGIAWNDTRTISNAGSGWQSGSVVQSSGGSSNLGVGIERKGAEVTNIAGANQIARFTMSATGTLPASVMSLSFFRDGVVTTTDEDGTIDDIENVSTVYTTNTSNIVVRTSASAPGGGTGGSEVSKYFAFIPRYYKPTGTTIGANPDFKFVVLSGDDTDVNFGFALAAYKQNQLGSTLTLSDENVSPDHDYFGLSLNATVAGLKSVPLDYSQDINPTGTTAFMLHSEGDGFGFGTWNYLEVGDYSGNTPAFVVYPLTYPELATPLRMLMGMGT